MRSGKGLRGRESQGRGRQLSIRMRAARAAVWLWSLARGGLHMWIILAMLVVGGILHYANLLTFYNGNGPFGGIEHSMDRVLLMVPVVYGAFIFGFRGGFFTLAAITGLMLPRVFLISSNPLQALSETFAVVLVSGLVILCFGGQQSERKARQETLSKFEMARLELASHVEIITKNERQLAAINEVCHVVAQDLQLPHILQRILDKVVEVMGAPVALIFLKDETGQKLELVAYKGVSQNFARALVTLRIGNGFNGVVAQSGEAMVVEDASEDPRLSVPQVKEEGLRSQLIVPLCSKGITIGTLCVAVRSSRRFSEDDMGLMTAIGSQVGIAIENARLYREALASEERYRDLFENATVAIFVHDLGGVITTANKACTNLIGYPTAELIGMNLNRLFPSSSLDSLAAVEQKLLLGEAITEPYEVQLARKDGIESILSMNTRLISENNQPRGFQHIARDVTEQRRMRNTMNYYIRQILTAQEDERKRIARELHDETAQSLLLISQRLDGLASGSHNNISSEARAYLKQVRGVVIATLSNLRHLTQDLRPRILDDLGLVAALEWLADDMGRESDLKVNVKVAGPQRLLSIEAQLLLFRIAQGALSNVRRHAAASQANILLEYYQDKVRLTVQDNGRGFKIPDNLADLAVQGKLGILGMQERAKLLDGTLLVRSELGRGTVVVAELPA